MVLDSELHNHGFSGLSCLFTEAISTDVHHLTSITIQGKSSNSGVDVTIGSPDHVFSNIRSLELDSSIENFNCGHEQTVELRIGGDEEKS